MRTTEWLSQEKVVFNLLEREYGQRVSLLQIKHPFVNESRREIASHTQYISKYRRKYPNRIVTNVVREIDWVRHSWYMLHEEGDGLEQQENRELNELLASKKEQENIVIESTKRDLKELHANINDSYTI